LKKQLEVVKHRAMIVHFLEVKSDIEKISFKNWSRDEVIDSFIDLVAGFSRKLDPNIITSEGTMAVNVGDWIIKEPFDKERQFYPCKPDIFAQTYDPVLVTVKDSVDSDGTYELISQHDTPKRKENLA